LKKVLHDYKLLIISIASPIQLGVYKDNILIDSVKSDKKTSEILLPLITEMLDKYSIKNIIYVRGPGSYMAIKLTYIILKTIKIIKDINFDGCDGFLFNNNRPIKALGSLYFIKNNKNIITKRFDNMEQIDFVLPLDLNHVTIDKDNRPLYILPAV
jgi:hypothetical protein